MNSNQATERWRNLRARIQAHRPREWYRITNADGGEGTAAQVDLYDEIGYFGVGAQDFVAELRSITAPAINLHINSPGGDVYDGLAIYNAILDHPAAVTVTVDGLAASAASFIAQAGDRIVMGRNAEMMIHDAFGMTIGNAAEHREMADLLDKASDNIASIYAARAGNGGVKTWRARMASESWYSAQEAVDVGLADEVQRTTRRTNDASPPGDRWDLSLFRHNGRQAAGPSEPGDDDDHEPEAPPAAATKKAAPKKEPAADPVIPPDWVGPNGEPPAPIQVPPEDSALLIDILAQLDPEDLDPVDTAQAVKALHRAFIDAAETTALVPDETTTALREALEDFTYRPDVLRASLLDALEHPDPPDPADVAPTPAPTHIPIDLFVDATREALFS